MKTNKDYILRKLAGEYVLVPTGKASQDLNGMIILNEVGAFIWEHVDESSLLGDLIHLVLEEFEVDQETATRDVIGFVGELFARDIIQDVSELKRNESYE